MLTGSVRQVRFVRSLLCVALATMALSIPPALADPPTCVDIDGDGFGNGANGNSGCPAGTTTDCNDDQPDCTTDCSRVFVTPADGVVGVTLSSNVVVNFCAPVDPATVTTASFTVRDCSDLPLAGDLVLSRGGLRVTFDPTSPLASKTRYFVTLTSAIQSLAHLPITPSVTSFGTGTAAGSDPVRGNEPGVTLPGTTLYGSVGDIRYPTWNAPLGFVNNDGHGDFATGAPLADENGIDSGVAIVQLGGPGLGTGGTSPSFRFRGEAPGDYAGFKIAGAGDVNGDGRYDLLIGAPGHDAGGADSGRIYLIFGSDSWHDGDVFDLAQVGTGIPGLRFDGAAAGEALGMVIAGRVRGNADVNNDGAADLIFGAPFADPGGRTDAGKAYLLFGPFLPGTYSLADVGGSLPGIVYEGILAGDQAGHGVQLWTDPGAPDGDGLDDVLIGSPGADPAGFTDGGRLYLINNGNFTSGTVNLSRINNNAPDEVTGAIFFGEQDNLRLGYAVVVQPNGTMFAVSAEGCLQNPSGIGLNAVFVIHTSQTGGPNVRYSVKGGGGTLASRPVSSTAGKLELACGSEGELRVGDHPALPIDFAFGDALDFVGDVDGTPGEDLAIGFPFDDVNGHPGAGRVVIISGTALIPGRDIDVDAVGINTPGIVIEGTQDGGGLGWSVSGGQDVTGDGLIDIIAGAPYEDAPIPGQPGQSIVDAGSLLIAAFSVPVEPGGSGALLIEGPGIEWGATPGASHYNLYRGLLSRLKASKRVHTSEMTCLANDTLEDSDFDGQPDLTDTIDPPVGDGFYYLLTAENRFGESSLGFDTNHVERVNDGPCTDLGESATFGQFTIPGSDLDGDGRNGLCDNCPTISNPNQEDADSDGAGDVCDPCPMDALNDFDQDGLCGNLDNCPMVANLAQSDSDGDGVGNVCDNCPAQSNANQADTDKDGTGNVCDFPAVSVTPAAKDFGQVIVGVTANALIEVHNTGTDPLTVSSIAVVGAGYQGFPPLAFTLLPDQTQSIVVGFSPQAIAAYHGTLTFQTNAPTSPTIQVPLDGTGRAPSGAELPEIETVSWLDFGSVAEGGVGTRNLTITNSGNAPLVVSAAGTGHSAFTAAPLTGSFPISVNPHSTRSLIVRFEPGTGSAGTSPNTILTITSNDPDEGAVLISLSGVVTEPEPEVDLSVLGARIGSGPFDLINPGNVAAVGGQVVFGADASAADTFRVVLTDRLGSTKSSAGQASPAGASTVAFSGINAGSLADGAIAVTVVVTRGGSDLPAFVGTPAVKSTSILAPPVLDPLPPVSVLSSVNVCGTVTAGATLRISGGASVISSTLSPGTSAFCLSVPLRTNQQNSLIVSAEDTFAPDPKPVSFAAPLTIVQVSASEIAIAEVTSTPLGEQEVATLVTNGVINLDDPNNYNVSIFSIVFTVGSFPVTVTNIVAVPIPGSGGGGTIIGGGGGGWGSGGSSGGCTNNCSTVVVTPCTDCPPGMPTIPGVIIIDGTIRTLKELFQVTVALFNASNAFVLSDVNAHLHLPAGLTAIAAEVGTDIGEVNADGATSDVRLGNIPAHSTGTGQFVVRGDKIGTHAVDVAYEGFVTGGGIPEGVPFSGSAGTTVQVFGPPELGVVVRHPRNPAGPDVALNEIYSLVVEITNRSNRPALYTSLDLFAGGDSLLVGPDDAPLQGSHDLREYGTIPAGGTVASTFRVKSLAQGELIACQAVASENISLTIDTGPDGTPCSIANTIPADFQPLPADAPPTILAISPLNGARDVPVTTSVLATFTPAIGTGCLTTDTWSNVVTQPIGGNPINGFEIVSATLATTGNFFVERLDPTGNPVEHIPVDLNLASPPAGGRTIATLRLGLDVPLSQVFLDSKATYRVTLLGADTAPGQAVCNASTNAPMAHTYRWTFTAAPICDGTLPVVTLAEPANGSTGRPLNQAIVLDFTKSMNRATFAFNPGSIAASSIGFYRDAVVAGADLSAGTPIPGTATFSESDSRLTFIPSGPLPANAFIHVRLTNALKDICNFNLQAAGGVRLFSFRTAPPDTTAPAPPIVNPVPSLTNLSAVIVSGQAEPYSSIRIQGGSSSVTVNTPASGLFAATVPLTPNQANLLSVDSTDAAGNMSAVVTQDSQGDALNVYYDAIALSILSVTPANGAFHVGLNAGVSVTFSEPIQPGSVNALNFTLAHGGVSVPGTFALVGNSGFTFTPTAPLLGATTYVVTLRAAGVRDLGGTGLTTAATSSFTTVAVQGSGLRLWLRSDQGVEVDGSNQVTAWRDQSGHGNDLTQASVSNRPLLVTGGINGLPAVRVDDNANETTDDFLDRADGLGIPADGPRTFVVVMRVSTTGRVVGFFQGTYATTLAYHLDIPGSTYGYYFGGNFAETDRLADLATHAHILETSSIAAGTPIVSSVRYSIDGQVPSISSANSLSSAVPVASSMIGYPGFGSSGVGDIYEVLVYDRVLGATERTQLEDYLAFRYGLTLAPQVTGVSPATATRGQATQVTFTGIHLEGATGIVSGNPAITGSIVNASPTTVVADINVPLAATSGATTLGVQTPGGSSSVPFTIAQPTLSFTPAGTSMSTRASAAFTVVSSIPAGPGGLLVNLASSGPALTTPATVTIPASAVSVGFNVTSTSTAGSVNLTAGATGYGGASAPVLVVARGLDMTIPLVGLGQTVQASVVLSAPAPAGGATILLSSANTSVASVSVSSVFIPAGSTTAPFSVTGGNSIASTTVTANGTADGYISLGRTVNVTNRLIDLPPARVLALGETTTLQVLVAPDPAPAGGLLIDLSSSDPAIIEVLTPTVTIPQGASSTTASVRALNQAGTATITASNPGFLPDTMSISVTTSLAFELDSVNIDDGATRKLHFRIQSAGNLYPTPSPVQVTLGSSDPACVAITTPATVATGDSFGYGTASYGGSAPLPCNATITATNGLFGNDTMTVTIANDPAPIGTLSVQTWNTPQDQTLGAGLQAQYYVVLSTGLHGGVTVLVESADPTRARLATSSTAPGSPVIALSIPAGNSQSVPFYAQGQPGVTGPVTLTATERKFSSGSLGLNVLPPVLSFAGTLLGTTTSQSANDPFTISTYTRNASNQILQNRAVSPGAGPLTITLTSGTPSVGTLVTNAFPSGAASVTVTIQPGQTDSPNTVALGGVAFDPVSGGSTTVSASAPGFVSFPASDTVTVNITQPTMALSYYNSASDLRLGAGLQARYVILLGASGHGGVTVRVTSSDPSRALLSLDPTTPGAAFIDVTIPNGSAQSSPFYGQGVVGALGAVSLSADETGPDLFAPAAPLALEVVQPVLSFAGTLATSTTTLSANDPFTISPYVRNASNTLTSNQMVSPAAGPLTITLTSGTPSVGTLVTNAFPSGAGGIL